MESQPIQEGHLMQIILWFRNDLRLHDNEMFQQISEILEQYPGMPFEVVPVYCFDPRIYNEKTKYESKKCGIHRARF